jgi:hypothetical protein
LESGAQRAKGYHAEEIVGQHFSVFYTDADRDAGLPALAWQPPWKPGALKKTGCASARTVRTSWPSVVIERILDEGSGHWMGFAKITRDMSERRQQELELLRPRNWPSNTARR